MKIKLSNNWGASEYHVDGVKLSPRKRYLVTLADQRFERQTEYNTVWEGRDVSICDMGHDYSVVDAKLMVEVPTSLGTTRIHIMDAIKSHKLVAYRELSATN